ncbi:hypothetical protein Tco_0964954 [Tanacetum coccineum]
MNSDTLFKNNEVVDLDAKLLNPKNIEIIDENKEYQTVVWDHTSTSCHHNQRRWQPWMSSGIKIQLNGQLELSCWWRAAEDTIKELRDEAKL